MNLIFMSFAKRTFDIFFSSCIIILFFPLFIILFVLVYFKLGHPVIFKQKRIGLHEKIFTVFKFRTMTDEKDEQGNLLTDEERLPAFGKWLRKTSLDELPQMINIFKGEMSFVGPRPLLSEHLELFSEIEKQKRQNVRPGLTGWAQINGRNSISWEQKLKFDIWYVENQSLWLDFKIMLKTIKVVMHQKDIFSEKNIAINFSKEKIASEEQK